MHVENNVDYFNRIAKGIIENNKRAVLVFFSTHEKLMEFYNSNIFETMK